MSEHSSVGRTHLERQLQRIERACTEFDQGSTDAALYIALACRVLFHNTKSQTGLFSREGWRSLTLLSTAGDVSGRITGALSSIVLGPDGFMPAHRPFLGDVPGTHHQLLWDKWWEQVVYPKHLGSLTRRSLVTIAANKELAHSDEKLPAVYARLKNGFWERTDTHGGTSRIVEVQLADLRQIGFEVLNSGLTHQLGWA